ncbi:O-antigen ligase family protein [Turicibacter sanguinis]|uniref:O-antigen ligase family protein n=1 Tax=Turicibacter sanguinis TaxID=154288 RepID=UPI0018A928C1|nr:O-antigen ligase family protein [Turicibacter sanguinis]MDB8558557.1 O-antigen ligase family protein [Turicibacter sanguinis]MDB8561353.1 O-antigen ligase family protein [Turicibacter sanguinis]
MDLVQEVNAISEEVIEETSDNGFKTWYAKLPIKPIDILNIILIMGYLQSWMYVEFVNYSGFGWDIFLIQGICTAGMLLVSAYYFITNRIEKKPHNWALIALISLMVISNLWSYSPNRGGMHELVIFLIYAIYLKNKYSTKQFLYLFTWLFLAVTVLSVWYMQMYPEVKLQDGFMWRGMFGHKNTLGMAMGMGITMMLILLLNYNHKLLVKIFLIGLICIESYVLLKSVSVTSYLATIMAVALVIKHKFFPIKHIWWYIVAFIFGGFILVFFHEFVSQPIAMITGKSPTFTGRTVIWDICKEYFYQRPWFGYGYNGIWSRPELLETVSSTLNEHLTETHNSLFDIMLQFGVVGLGLYILTLKKFCDKVKNNGKEILLFFIVALLMFIGYGEVVPISFNSPYLIIFLYCVL